MRCPEDNAVESYAAGQYFERGLIMRVEDSDTFYVFYEGEVEGIDARVRVRLGWATEPEFGFTTTRQCQIPAVPGAWSCFLWGPRGEIIRHGAMTNTGYPLVWNYHAEEQ